MRVIEVDKVRPFLPVATPLHPQCAAARAVLKEAFETGDLEDLEVENRALVLELESIRHDRDKLLGLLEGTIVGTTDEELADVLENLLDLRKADRLSEQEEKRGG